MLNKETSESEEATTTSQYEKMRFIMSWVIVIVLSLFGIFLMFKLSTVHETEGNYWKSLIREQFPVMVGLPMAGLGSLFLTLILRISTGPLEFEAGGIKFKGGAAPIVFWLICFLSCTFAIGFLWQT
jgi:hypothetical protein